jgi:hypothetical protein
MKKVEEEKYYNFLGCFRMPTVRDEEVWSHGELVSFVLKIKETGELITKYKANWADPPDFFIDTAPVIRYLEKF